MKKSLLTFIFLLAAQQSSASFQATKSQLPPELSTIAGRMSFGGNLAEGIETSFATAFSPQSLKMEIDWESSSVNAHAFYDDDDNAVIKIAGGMAKHKFLTLDGLALIACHELGHFLGGDPKKRRGQSSKLSWASAEGQADYFSVECLKALIENGWVPSMETLEEAPDRVVGEARSICRSSLCERLALASYSVAKVYAQVKFYNRELSFLNPSTYKVSSTILEHSDPQCRLDTMIAGILGSVRPMCWFAY